MTTVSELVDGSLRLLRAIDSGSSASTNELTDGVEALNMMLESWATGPQKIYMPTRENFTLTAGDSEYTIGSGGDFDTTRPIRIVDAYIRSSSTDYPLKPMHLFDYGDIVLKSLESLPTRIYYERDYPLGKIILDYEPSSADDLYIASHKEFPTYASDGSDTLSLPPGYERALKYNLAVEISPEYKKEVPPLVLGIAKTSLKTIKRLNSQPVPKLKTSPFSNSTGSYEIEADVNV